MYVVIKEDLVPEEVLNEILEAGGICTKRNGTTGYTYGSDTESGTCCEAF